ncbi:hypothetical protein [Calothrix sp. PCC 7507]|uniref:hypothetical protein n=1 Tax=Calothrix sp. PCC 7507 TaxID=99598 RepID=UPI0002D26169|nr:hypothetical protein [Calothrix sp. PCC 7507]
MRQLLQRGASRVGGFPDLSGLASSGVGTPAKHWLGYTDKTHLRGLETPDFV